MQEGGQKASKSPFCEKKMRRMKGEKRLRSGKICFIHKKTLTLFGAITIKKYTKVLPEVPETAPRTPKTPLQVGNSKTS